MGTLQPDDEFRRKRRTGWAIVAVLFGGSVVNYLDRAVLGVVMPQIRRDLVLTNKEYGWVVNAFLMAYMISYVLGGRLAGMLPRRSRARYQNSRRGTHGIRSGTSPRIAASIRS